MRIRFNIRDLLWLIAVIAVLLAWLESVPHMLNRIGELEKTTQDLQTSLVKANEIIYSDQIKLKQLQSELAKSAKNESRGPSPADDTKH